MNGNDIILRKKLKHNTMDIIKNMSLKPYSNSMKIFPQEDIKSINSTRLNRKNNSKYMQLFQNNISNNKHPITSSSFYSNNSKNIDNDQKENEIMNYKNTENNKYNNKLLNYFLKNKGSKNENKKHKNSYSYIDTDRNKINLETKEHKMNLTLIKKQNNKIDELFSLLESKDKKILLLQNENSSLHKYKHDFKISKQNNINITTLLNKYEDSLLSAKNDLKNAIDELTNYKNQSKEIHQKLNILRSENENIYITNQNLNKQIDMTENENKFLKKEKEDLINKVNFYEEKNKLIKNENEQLNKEIQNLNNVNVALNNKINGNNDMILQLQNHNNKLQNELKYAQNNDINNNQKLNEIQYANNELVNKNNILNEKYTNLKLYINDTLNFFKNQIFSICDKNEENINNIMKEHKNFNNNFPNFCMNRNNLNFYEEIPSLKDLELVYNKVKKIFEMNLDNYEKIKLKYKNKFNDCNYTLNYMNNKMSEMTKEISTLKEKNILLTQNNEINEKKLIEMNNNNNKSKTLEISNNNFSFSDNKIFIKFSMLEDFINKFYNNIMNKYSSITSTLNSSGKILLPNDDIKANDIKVNEDNENNIKSMIIEIETIFNNLYEYITYLGEKINTIDFIKKENNNLKNEKNDFVQRIDNLNNEINNLKIDNQNVVNNLKIKFEINLKEQIKEMDDKNNKIIKNLNDLLKNKEEEIINVNKNYNMLYNQYKQILKNKNISQNN